MLHPVGPLRPVVYWRRRLLALTVLAGLGAGGWTGTVLVSGRLERAGATDPAASALAPGAPALARVAPSLPAWPTGPEAAPAAMLPAAATGPLAGTTATATGTPAAVSSTPVPCSDDMLSLTLRAPGTVPAGSAPTFQLVVTDVAATACVRSVGADAQEVVLADAAGTRVWSSADCRAIGPAQTRTLTPGVPVSLPLTWDGRGSAPGCPAPRTLAPAGSYVLQGRLDTRTTAPTTLTLD